MIYRGSILAAIACACAGVLAGCHAVPARPAPAPDAGVTAAAGSGHAPDASPAASGDTKESEVAAADPADAPNSQAPCMPVDQKAKPTQKRRPRSAQHNPPGPSPEPVPTPTPASPADATVKPIAVTSASILGKQVQGLGGEDLGRVVDVLADAGGRVQIAIIEAGGFLGLGNRRIAVDWTLLKFHPEDPQGIVTLNVTKQRLQGAPEYKDAMHPLALMAPTAAPAPAPAVPLPMPVPSAVPVPIPEGKK